MTSNVPCSHLLTDASPLSLLRSLWLHRQLIWQMALREVVGRYKNSIFGLAWSFFNPICMLLVYTFVFSVVFKTRWGEGGQTSPQFAVILFAGLIVHGFFAEVLARAPGLVLSNVNYVKKVVFPLEILPVVSVFAALFHAFINFSVLILVFFWVNEYFFWTAIFFPIVLLPLVILTTGVAWVLASLGVYVRDVSQTIGIVLTGLMFLSPVFYPAAAMPEAFQIWIFLNPLTFIIEQAREVLIWGHLPDMVGLGVYGLISICISALGYAWFQKTRSGFADVL